MSQRNRPDEVSLYYFNMGESERAYEVLGAHPVCGGCRFAVWAPNARAVHVAGGFNGFDPAGAPMHPVNESGVWELTIPSVKRGDIYKYVVTGPDGTKYWRSDPYATRCETPPNTASMVWGIPEYSWGDAAYYEKKRGVDPFSQPMCIYEAHLGSFRKGLSYRELAHELVDYVAYMGYTHIEIMPIAEYPFDMSWGYQVANYFAATARYGTPEDLMYFVDRAHQHGLGVLLDWVPAHFPRDEHGLRCYDGAPLYEHADPRRSEQPQWGTLLFDYSRPQVQSFLVSNAFYWLEEFHFDGLRVDAVSCMLHHDYGRQHGQWLPNEFGGRENLEAAAFIRKLSAHIDKRWPNGGRLLIAEESTAYPHVTGPAGEGGLGFDYKWNMGWMNDTLRYMKEEPIYRKWHHDAMTFSLCYAFSERFILPFSHDEVVHGKHSMLDKMPGVYEDKFAQLRLVLAYQYAHPGKKLNFMGTEFGQFIEWRYDESLDWLLLDYPAHKMTQDYMRALNMFYKSHPPLYQNDWNWEGFSWISTNDGLHSVFAFIRWDNDKNGILCAFNFSPETWADYTVHLPCYGLLTQIFSTDDSAFGGRGTISIRAGMPPSETPKLTLPPFSAVFYRLNRLNKPEKAAM